MTRIPDRIHGRIPNRLPDELRFSNRCLGFDGGVSSQYVRVLDALSLRLTNTGAILFWFQPQGIPTAREGFVTKNSGGTAAFFCWLVYRPNANSIRLLISDGAASDIISLAFDYTDTRWSFVAARWDGAFLRLGINLVEAVPVVQTRNAQVGVGQNVRVGWSWGVSYLNGFMDEVIVLPTITDAQIREVYHQGYVRRGLDARLVMRLEEGTGLVATDESAYGNNGSLLPALTPPVWTPVRKYELLAEAGV